MYKILGIILTAHFLCAPCLSQDIEAEIGGVTFENQEVCLHDVYRQVAYQEVICSSEELEHEEKRSRLCTEAFWRVYDVEGVVRSSETPKDIQKQFWTGCLGRTDCKNFWSSCSEIAEACYDTVETFEYVDEECVKVCEPVVAMSWEGGVRPWTGCRFGDEGFEHCPIEFITGSGIRSGWWIFGTDSPMVISSLTNGIPGLWGIDGRQGKIVYYAGDENSTIDNDLYLPIKEEGAIETLYVCENPKTCGELMIERGYDPELCHRENISQN